METAFFNKKAVFIITPDTSIVHIAAAFKKKMIAIYREDLDIEVKNKNLWSFSQIMMRQFKFFLEI